MSIRPTNQDRRKLARRTGLAYFGIIATGIFAEFAVRGSLVVADDPIATADNIASSPGLFGAGIGADLLMIAFDVAVAVGLFRLLRHVDRRLALGAAALRLVQGAVLTLNLVHLGLALGSARDAVGPGGTILPGPAADALDAVERHAIGYDVGLVAFGLACVVLGRLLAQAGTVPRWLSVGMSATGGVYLVGSCAAVFAPDASAAIDPLYLIAFVVELAFATMLVTGRLVLPPVDSDDAGGAELAEGVPGRRPVVVA